MADPRQKQENVEKLLKIFERQREDGTYYFQDEDVRHFLPLLVLTMASEIEEAQWPEPVKALMGEFALRLELSDGASAEEMQAAIDKYYEASPVNEELLGDFQRLVREALAEGNVSELSTAASKLLGIEQRTLAPKEPPAKGAVSLTNLMLQGGTTQKDEED